MDQLSGLVWAFTRLQCQLEATKTAMERLHPDVNVRHLIAQEVKRIMKSDRLIEIGEENKKEILSTTEWIWLKKHGIDPDA